MYRRVIEEEEKVLSPLNSPARHAFINLGDMYRSLGRLEGARSCYSQAFLGYRNRFGQNHDICQVLLRKLEWLQFASQEQ
jgi:hypothetical protein